MRELVFATNNKHKLQEVRAILGSTVHILSLEEIGFFSDIPETQDTIEGNASQKAWFVYRNTGHDCFADDTGLEIESLGGKPGVYSARYAGEGCTFEDNVKKVLKEMEGLENRKACFRCVFSLIMDGVETRYEGRVDGEITTEPAGSGGFGYDPVFRPAGSLQTFAEMPAYLKNGISHRGRAATAMEKDLRKNAT